MIRCLCCNKEIKDATEYEMSVRWHKRCIRRFFGTAALPELDCSEDELERIANLTVSKGLTIPGVQKKLSLHLSSADKISKLTVVDYPTGYILKPQSGDFSHLPESEYATMKMAESVGIKTVPSALLFVGSSYVYITKRIDRVNGQKLAMEDFCQLSERVTADKYKGSYEKCGKIIAAYAKNVGLDMAEFYYRLLFCYITGNSDMHLKNFSMIETMPKSRIFNLSAAYDLLPVNLIMPEDKEEVALSLNGKKRNLRKKDFLKLAENLGIHNNTAEKLMSELVNKAEELTAQIKISYLPEEMKSDFVQLIDHRIRVLS